jgi:hypothetical protein
MSYQNFPLKAGVYAGNPIWVPGQIITSVLIQGGFSGRFCTISGGYLTPCTDSTQTIAGWVESETITAADNTSSGLYVRPTVMYDSATLFILPVYGTAWAQTAVGGLFDLIVDSNVQKVNLSVSTHDLVRVVGGYTGGSVATSYAIVQMNNKEFYGG